MDQIKLIGERLRRGEYLQARRMAEAVLASEDSGVEVKAAAAQLGAEAAYRLDEIHATINLARQAIALSEAAGDSDRLGRSWFRLCGALIAAGDYAAALEAGERFLTGLGNDWPELDAEFAAKTYANVAMARRNMRRYPDALQAYWQALSRFQAGGHVEGEINTRLQMAYLLVLMEQYDEAEEHIQQSSERLTPDVPGYLAVHQLTHAALLRLGQGRYTEAVETAQEVLVPGRPDVTDASRAVALYVAGMVALQTRSVPTAQIFSHMAREAAVSSGLAHVMNLVQRLAGAVRAATYER
jgi:tetratricopeptide (TPR) repeat protein